MKVIRIEHKDTGIGVFRAYNDSDKRNLYRQRFECMANRMNNLPEPHDEIWNLDRHTIYQNSSLICAFKNEVYLLTWIRINEIRELVRDWSMRIYEVEVDTPYVGRQQVVYEQGRETSKKDITSEFLTPRSFSSCID